MAALKTKEMDASVRSVGNAPPLSARRSPEQMKSKMKVCWRKPNCRQRKCRGRGGLPPRQETGSVFTRERRPRENLHPIAARFLDTRAFRRGDGTADAGKLKKAFSRPAPPAIIPPEPPPLGCATAACGGPAPRAPRPRHKKLKVGCPPCKGLGLLAGGLGHVPRMGGSVSRQGGVAAIPPAKHAL